MVLTRTVRPGACEEPGIDGVVHVTSPNPVQNREVMSNLRHALHRPWSPPTPKAFVHVGALFMRTDPALALTGRRAVPRRLSDAGFEFTHPVFAGALDDLLGRRSEDLWGTRDAFDRDARF